MLDKQIEREFDKKFSVFDGSQKIIKHVTYSSWVKAFISKAIQSERDRCVGVLEKQRDNWKGFENELPVQDLPPQIIEALDDAIKAIKENV